MNIRFIRPVPYESDEGLVVSEVVTFWAGFETVIGYITVSDRGFRRVWVL